MTKEQVDVPRSPAPGGPRAKQPYWPPWRRIRRHLDLQRFSRLELVAMAWNRGLRGFRGLSKQAMVKLLQRDDSRRHSDTTPGAPPPEADTRER